MAINFPSGPSLNQTYTYNDRTWTWNGQYWYVTAGAGAAGGSGVAARATRSVTSASLANNATGTYEIIGYKSYVLYKISTTASSRIRIYTSATAQTSDLSRALGTDPMPGNGILAEVLVVGTQVLSPGVVGFNDDAVLSNKIYVTVTNLSGATATITVTLTMNGLEN